MRTVRDPKRILRILNKLRQVWDMKPDQRFCQLFENYVIGYNNWGMLFYVEDNDLERHLDEIISGEIKI